MSLVSLASALFTVNSTFVFMVGPMHWDPGKMVIMHCVSVVICAVLNGINILKYLKLPCAQLLFMIS